MSDSSVPQAKQLWRDRIAAALAQISPEERAQFSAEICRRLRADKIWRDAKCILGFAPMPGEPDIWPLLREALAEGKTLALPWFDPESRAYEARVVRALATDLHRGHWEIPEPKPGCARQVLNQLDLVLVPGVGFAPDGRRLGRGKGHYDRLLKPVRGITCGIAFDAQIVDALPGEPHDIGLDCILTPTRWLRPGRGRF